MAFQNLRSGGTLYILHKDGAIRVEQAEVTSVTMPTMRFGVGYQPNQSPLYVVDIATKVGDATYNFPQVPAQLDIVDYGANGNVVISTSAEIVAQEIASIKRKSEDAIASVERHKATIKQCDDALSVIRPADTVTAENEALRQELAEMRKLLLDLKAEKPTKTKEK